MEIQGTNLKTRPEAPLNQNKNELEPESKVCFEIKTEQTLLETCERGTLHYRMHWPHNQQAGPILQSIEEWKKSLTPAKKCACVFISVHVCSFLFFWAIVNQSILQLMNVHLDPEVQRLSDLLCFKSGVKIWQFRNQWPPPLWRFQHPRQPIPVVAP